MVPTCYLGFDFGNAETGAVFFDAELGYMRSLTMPSATAPGHLADLLRTRSGLGLSALATSHWPENESGEDSEGDNGHVRHVAPLSSNEYVLEYEGGEWFIGDLALTQARDASTARGDISRYWSKRALHLLLTSSAALLPPSVQDFGLEVVTGLPVETFHTETRRKVRAALEGRHDFTLNGKRHIVQVRVLSVIMEGAGALITNGSTRKITQGCIDVGGRTTDLFVANGQQPILPLCQGKPLGVEHVGDLLSDHFEAVYGRPLKAAELRSILRAYAAVKQAALHAPRAALEAEPLIYASGKQVPFDELLTWCGDLFAEAGAEIATFVGAAWNSSEMGAVGADIAQVVLVGGGAYYVADQLKARIPHLVVPSRPELANATGYAALAQELARRKTQGGGAAPSSTVNSL